MASRRPAGSNSGSVSAPMPRAGDGRFSGVLASPAAAFREDRQLRDKITSVDTSPWSTTKPVPTTGVSKEKNGGGFPRDKSAILPGLEPGLLNTSH
jgi:hypothetical protein